MPNKDDYEIPSFVNKENSPEDIDMSVFQMEDEEEEMPPKRPNPYHKQRLIMVIIIAVLAIMIAVGGIFFAVTKYQEAQRAEELAKQQEQERLETEKAKEEAAKKEAEEKAKQEAEAKAHLGTYMIQDTVRMRVGHGLDFDVVDYDSLPESIRKMVEDEYLPEGATVEVLEYYQDPTTHAEWGRIAESVWFCISLDGDIYASKE